MQILEMFSTGICGGSCGQGSQIVGIGGDICLVEGGGHVEKQRMESLVRRKVTTNEDFCQCFLGCNFSSFCHLRKTLGHHGGRTPRPAAILGREHCVCGSTRCSGSSCECLAACFSCRLRSWQRDQHVLPRMADGQSVASSERGAPSRKLTSCRRTLLRQQSLSELYF